MSVFAFSLHQAKRIKAYSTARNRHKWIATLFFDVSNIFIKNAFISKTRANSAKIRPFLESAHLIYLKTVEISSAKICVLTSGMEELFIFSFQHKILKELFIETNTALSSSASAESIFSIEKDLLKPKRAGISDAHFEMLLFN